MDSMHRPLEGVGSSVAQQQTIRDFGAARSKAIKDVKGRLPMKRRRGFPKFKKKDLALPSINYTRRGFSLKDGRLHLAGGIGLGIVWSRGLPSEPTSVRISRDATGRWWASFVVKVEAEPLLPVNRVIGIDWGVTDTAITTDPDFDLPHSQRGKSAAARLARYQRMMARRKRPKGQAPSKGYKTAKAQAAKAYAKVARTRTDDARKWAKSVVRSHDQIAVEDFRPKFLAQTTMARKSADAAIGQAQRELIWMAPKQGRDLRLVDPAYTTMDCGDCGVRAKHRLPLSERTYTCSACGVVRPRDRNSAAAARNPPDLSVGRIQGRQYRRPVPDLRVLEGLLNFGLHSLNCPRLHAPRRAGLRAMVSSDSTPLTCGAWQRRPTGAHR
jgi:putative transposase